MTAFNFDRDLRFIEPDVDSPSGTIVPVTYTSDLDVLLDGVVYDSVGTFHRSSRSAFSLANNSWFGIGVTLDEPYSDRGVYRMRGMCCHANFNIRMLSFIGIAPASPSSGMNTVLYPQFLNGIRNRDLSVDDTVCLSKFGTIASVDYSSRKVVAGFAFENLSGGTINEQFMASMSVQRLDVKGPVYASAVR
jgi:hypothetical protein